MREQENSIGATPEFTLEERRAFHRLPLAERRRRLAEQAERALADYQTPSAIEEREAWQSGDIIEVFPTSFTEKLCPASASFSAS